MMNVSSLSSSGSSSSRMAFMNNPELDPNAILMNNGANGGNGNTGANANVGITPGKNEIEGGLPNTNPKQQQQYLTDELHKKQHAFAELEEKYKQAQSQLQEQKEKIAKYESVVEELYKSRRRYGQSEEQK
eukprot:CAMPEP_0113652616 /NCGR_PEP_ID=MMETSP0017_2-20120614/28107_1 /TAXON_ID=2856 /ORGANISM="Cylindrotheca closterium" /LENGTH=130 /DNA_ID=CAMNT_0000565487 /DNA_START=286 /DNA_END=675 /DNA_ORIENTATION=+ /assembly_acc=CAM_ASM_000147